MQYYILKQFVPNAEVWVAKLNDVDAVYSYPSLEAAEGALPSIQLLYPDTKLRIQCM